MKKKLTIYTFFEKWSFDAEFELSHRMYQPDSDADKTVVPITNQEIEIEVPDVTDIDLVTPQVERLKKLRTVAQAKVNEIQTDIDNLLALEHKDD